MPKEIYLVKVGMTMTEGMVSEWYIQDGAAVQKGEMLYALETEKVNMDVDAESDGVVRQLAEVGVMMEPGDVVGYIYEAGEVIPEKRVIPEKKAMQSVPVRQSEPAPLSPVKSAADPGKGNSNKSSPAARRLARELDIDIATLQGTGPGGRITSEDVQRGGPVLGAELTSDYVRASPLAKKIAIEKGIELKLVVGTGPGSRIVEADLVAYSGSSLAVDNSGLQGKSQPVKGIRKVIAKRMHSSLQNSAQLTMDMEVVMEESARLREQLINEWSGESVRPTYTDLVVKAVAKTLPAHPMMNSIFGENEITRVEEVHVGIAVALQEGLVVPVIRHADQLSLKEIAIESARLANSAKEGALGLDDYAGGTFTVSSLGMYGVDSFTPILNEPQTGILGVNRIFDGLEWDEDRPVKTRKMNLSLTWDHRVLDGAPAAQFLTDVQILLAQPYRLLV